MLVDKLQPDLSEVSKPPPFTPIALNYHFHRQFP